MKTPDIYLNPVNFKNDSDATREFAAIIAKLTDLLRDIYDNLQTVKILTSAPTATELQELLSKSDVVIVHNALQTSRRIYYKYQGTVFYIESD